MGSVPAWVDQFYALFTDPYLPDTETSKARIEQGLPKVTKNLPTKGSQVLDLCCGAGAYLFPLERAGYLMTGVDIQERMVLLAKKHAMKTGSKAKIVLGDAMKLKFKSGVFDAVVFLGAPFGHFSLDEFARISKEGFRVLRRGGVMVTEVNDHIALIISGLYQRTLYEPAGDEDVISIHTRYDAKEGTYNRLFLNLENNKRFKGSFHIWSPWILQHLMGEVGFKLKSADSGAFGMFSQMQVYKKP